MVRCSESRNFVLLTVSTKSPELRHSFKYSHKRARKCHLSIIRLDNISTFSITCLSYCHAHVETPKTDATTRARDNNSDITHSIVHTYSNEGGLYLVWKYLGVLYCGRVPATNASGCTAAEGLLYKPWSLDIPTCTARCLHQIP